MSLEWDPLFWWTPPLSIPPAQGMGVVGVGMKGTPSMWRIRRELCAELGHPGACFNTPMNKTWCQCGEVIREGDHFTHVACAAPCGGPRGGALIEWLPPHPWAEPAKEAVA